MSSDSSFHLFRPAKANAASRKVSRYVSYLTAAKVAKQLGVTSSMVRQYAESGVLPVKKRPDGRLEFVQADVDAFQAKRKGKLRYKQSEVKAPKRKRGKL